MPFSRQLEKIKQGKLWRFFGGIKPLERKATTNSPIEELAIPALITLPLDRHLGPGGQILVRVGDYVKAGQPLTIPGGKRNVPLHASTSGHVTGIGMQVLPHPSGFLGRCITIKPDGLDAKVPDQPMPDWQDKTARELLDRIRLFGVEGLGGAQFQTAAKIEAALDEAKGDCNIFIVNGAECEPVATCDDRLMQERATDIAQGIEIVRKILNPKAIIVAIEDNKPKALEAMQQAVASDILIRKIPTLYPSGAARNLIKICTGIEIPYAAHTSECGIVVDNVETVFAIKQAVIDGVPLIKRVVTVDGMTLGRNGNALVRLGTSVRFVLNAYKLNPERRQRVILGGPFMGFTLPSIDVPITKSCTCVFAPSNKEVELQPQEMNCIRCGRCARVCPSRLVPYQLYALSKAGQHKQTKSCGMMDCTECGCCAYVCPSKIPLSNQFRKEKAIIRILDDQQRRSIRAKERMNARNERLQKEEAARKQRRAAALARMEANKNASPDDLKAKREAALALARQRAAAKRNALNGATGINGSTGLNDATGHNGSHTARGAFGSSTESTLAQTQANAFNDIKAQSAQNAQSTSALDGVSTAELSLEAQALTLSQAKHKKHTRDFAQGQGSSSTVDASLDTDLDEILDATNEAGEPIEAGEAGKSRAISASALEKKRTSQMLAQTKDGALVAAMLAQGGTSSMINDLGADAAAQMSKQALGNENESGADENATKDEHNERLPYYLRKSARPKHAIPLNHWNAVPEHASDLSIVENPPAAGEKIQPSQPKSKTYLQAAYQNRKVNKLPRNLARKDLTPEELEALEHEDEIPEPPKAQPKVLKATNINVGKPLPGQKRSEDASMVDHKFKFTYGTEPLENRQLETRRIQATVGGTKVNVTLSHAATMEEAEYLANMHPALNDPNNGTATLGYTASNNETNQWCAPGSEAAFDQPAQAQAKSQGQGQAQAQDQATAGADQAASQNLGQTPGQNPGQNQAQIQTEGQAQTQPAGSQGISHAQPAQTEEHTPHLASGADARGSSTAQGNHLFAKPRSGTLRWQAPGAEDVVPTTAPIPQTNVSGGKIKQQRYGNWALPKQQASRWVAPGADEDDK